MQMIIDEKKWQEAWLDTPFGIKTGATMQEAFETPGACVKSIEMEGMWPKYCGKLVAIDKEREQVVVRGYGDMVSPKFVWTGSRAEYYRFWRID